MAKRLILLRHARPSPATAGKLIGSTDLPLDPAGLAQARAMRSRMAKMEAGRCYASPMTRCRQTAAEVAGDLAVEFYDDLREIDFGRWENRRFEELAAAEPKLVDRWAAFDPEFAFPGGESLGGFCRRVDAAADRLAGEESDTVLAVTHGGVIRAMLCRLLELSPRQYVIFEVGYGGMAVVHLHDGRGVLAGLENVDVEEAAHG